MPDEHGSPSEQVTIGVVNQQMIDLRREMNRGFTQLSDAIAENGKQNAETSKQLAIAVTESSKNYQLTNMRIDSVEKMAVECESRLHPIEGFVRDWKARIALLIGVCSAVWIGGSWWYVNVHTAQQEAVKAAEQRDETAVELTDKLAEILEALQNEPTP